MAQSVLVRPNDNITVDLDHGDTAALSAGGFPGNVAWKKDGSALNAADVASVAGTVGATHGYVVSDDSGASARVAIRVRPATPTIESAVAVPGGVQVTWVEPAPQAKYHYAIDVSPQVSIAGVPMRTPGARVRGSADKRVATLRPLPPDYYTVSVKAVAGGLESAPATTTDKVYVSESVTRWPHVVRWALLVVGASLLALSLLLLENGPTTDAVKLESWALLIGVYVAGGGIGILLFFRRPADLLQGDDGRASTSKANFAVWTIVIVFALATLTAISSGATRFGRDDPCDPQPEADGDATVKQVCVGGEARDVADLELGNVFEEGLTANYLVLLGAPFAGLAGARWIVNRQVNTGTRQKVENQDEPQLSHLLTNDEGDADLADAQYLLFTVVLLFYFFANFLPTPYALPDLPWGLVGLTGLSAGTFLLNKTVTDNGLTVDGMSPTQVKKGEAAELRIVGRNFLPEGSSQFANGGVSVQIGSTPVLDPRSVTDSAIVVPVPTDLTEGTHQVVVATAANILGSAGSFTVTP